MNPTPLTLTPEIIEAINEELAYQATLPAQGRADTKNYGVEGQLITLYTYTQQALNAWTKNAGPEPCLHELRKVAAIAIRALLIGGCPRRKL